jgi:hypothetical protein
MPTKKTTSSKKSSSQKSRSQSARDTSKKPTVSQALGLLEEALKEATDEESAAAEALAHRKMCGYLGENDLLMQYEIRMLDMTGQVVCRHKGQSTLGQVGGRNTLADAPDILHKIFNISVWRPVRSMFMHWLHGREGSEERPVRNIPGDENVEEPEGALGLPQGPNMSD